MDQLTLFTLYLLNYPIKLYFYKLSFSSIFLFLTKLSIVKLNVVGRTVPALNQVKLFDIDGSNILAYSIVNDNKSEPPSHLGALQLRVTLLASWSKSISMGPRGLSGTSTTCSSNLASSLPNSLLALITYSPLSLRSHCFTVK
ncbi:hypothetical protein BpHYR1_000788 [Brachionus plicatilis]|uniref:Uncharacterized protein n=1 Tax=Brachionus plicatilis TaxID=10195 RepID=A0A3M7SW72_BRAPC|nr:hypothetical protein BpHYR1_000788 [Brachionus plicatilis]